MTLDEIRLQQLLQPFENQNTGVMSTNNALPFINTGQVNQNLQNQDLVNQIIKENMQKNISNFVNVPQTYYPPTTGGITNVSPQQTFQDFYSPVYEPYDPEKDDEQVSYNELTGQLSFGDRVKGILESFSQRPGISSVIGAFNPLAGLITKGIGTLFNRFQPAFQDFRRSESLADFFQTRRDAKAREEAAARGLAKQRSQAMQAMTSNQAYSGDGGGGRPGGFGQGAGDFSASDPTATEGSF